MANKININVSNRALAILGVFGALLIGGGVYLGFSVLPEVITNKIWETKILKENTEQWDIFVKTPFAFTFKIRIFDIQNPDDILQGAKPILKEVGPFVYRAYKWKNEIEWNTPDEISYNAYMRFEFDKEASGIYTEDTEVTILNTPYLSILLKVEATPELFALVEQALPVAFGENAGLFIKVKVKDFLWDGVKFCKNEGKDGGFGSTLLCKKVIENLPNSKNLRLENKTVLFANMYYKNNTHLGRFTVKAGTKKKEETSMLSFYDGKPYISTWTGEKSTCNKIRGVTNVFPADIQTDMTFESYAEDICRHVALKFDSKDTVKELKGYKFVAKNDTFSSSLPENSCFCANKSKTFDTSMGCVGDGITDLTPCKGGLVMVSFPHLLYGQKEYINSVEGLNPDKNKHEPFIILEPKSGLPLYGAQRIQFNMFLRPIEGMDSTANFSRSLIPLVWIEESFIIPDKYVNKLNENLFHSLSIVNIVKWIVIISGGACVLLAGLTLVYRQAP